MKKMTCKQLGGACDIEFLGESFDDIASQSKKHGMEMFQKGELGKIQYMAASHPQDMDGWPDYWQKMIPMHYATHVVSPVLGLVNGRAEYVSCFGSGTISEDLIKNKAFDFLIQNVKQNKK